MGTKAGIKSALTSDQVKNTNTNSKITQFES